MTVKILILHPGALGDTLLALPAIKRLRTAFPSAHLTLAGNIDHLDCIVSGYVESVCSLSTIPLYRLYTSEHFSEDDVRFWKSFDWIVSWTGSGNPDFCRNLKSIHPEACIAAWKPVPGDPRHVAQIFADSLRTHFPCSGKLEPAQIDPGAGAMRAGRQWLRDRRWNERDPLTVIHPGAGGKWKRWPLQRFIELARHLAIHEERRLVIIEGPAEHGTARQIAEAIPESDLIVSECADLKLLSGILGQCRNYIGNDSGLSHLAAGLGLRCKVLFGPTSPQHWAPLGPHVTVFRDYHGCAGCESGFPEHTCLENIPVESLFADGL